jgi:hypothetical protein
MMSIVAETCTQCGGRGEIPSGYTNQSCVKQKKIQYSRVSFCDGSFYDPCRVGSSTPDLWCNNVATQASFLYLVRF